VLAKLKDPPEALLELFNGECAACSNAGNDEEGNCTSDDCCAPSDPSTGASGEVCKLEGAEGDEGCETEEEWCSSCSAACASSIAWCEEEWCIAEPGKVFAASSSCSVGGALFSCVAARLVGKLELTERRMAGVRAIELKRRLELKSDEGAAVAELSNGSRQ
jgi:hypothetical protein